MPTIKRPFHTLSLLILLSLVSGACEVLPTSVRLTPDPTATPAPPTATPARPTATHPAPTPTVLPANTFGSVDNTTFTGKVVAGYQGWFGCPGDGSRSNEWWHWFHGTGPAGLENLKVDFWPDVSELTERELCDTGMVDTQGNPLYAFSNYNPLTVMRHFYWMAQYGIDGVELQRFVSAFGNYSRNESQDRVLENVRHAAETYGRVFYIQYAGMQRANLERIKEDWQRLVDDQQITSSPSYLHHKDLPVVAIWGIGFKGNDVLPNEFLELIDFFQNNPDPKYRAIVEGGVPSYWRTLSVDSKDYSGWADVYRALDIINPWHVNSINSRASADAFLQNVILPDLAETRALGIEYVPVIFPGFSANNLGLSGYNYVPREGGAFFWKLAYNVIAQDVKMIEVAMWDEVDEGTAIFKVVESADQLLAEPLLVPLDIDGYDLPSDWYLTLTGQVTRMLRGEIPLSAALPVQP